MPPLRRFTVLDGAAGPVVYRYVSSTTRDLIDQLTALGMTARCAFEVASHAWAGAVVAFDGFPFVVVPGDHPVTYGNLDFEDAPEVVVLP